MERNIRLVLAYDGTGFHGWQRQEGVRTVQADLEDVLRRVLRHPLHATGASRTDAGVHALGQVASVMTTTAIPVKNLARAIGHHLPRDVALLHTALADPAFHPSLDATSKLYRYRIYNAHTRPTQRLLEQHAWHVWYTLDIDVMRAAAAALVGTHDFAAFASQGSPRESTVRTLRRIQIDRRGFEVRIDVEGDGFLYHQVRNMVGTLIEIGRGRWKPARMAQILASRDRREAGQTAPPQGLCLRWVRYERAWRTGDGAA